MPKRISAEERQEYDRQRRAAERLADPEGMKSKARAHYAKNADHIKKQVNTRRTSNRVAVRKMITELKSKPCADCRKKYPPYCMDFDHIKKGKKFNISEAARNNYSITTIKAEIDKCEVVCSNCHRIRTHARLVKKHSKKP